VLPFQHLLCPRHTLVLLPFIWPVLWIPRDFVRPCVPLFNFDYRSWRSPIIIAWCLFLSILGYFATGTPAWLLFIIIIYYNYYLLLLFIIYYIICCFIILFVLVILIVIIIIFIILCYILFIYYYYIWTPRWSVPLICCLSVCSRIPLLLGHPRPWVVHLVCSILVCSGIPSVLVTTDYCLVQ
jgi:hypothetical protein